MKRFLVLLAVLVSLCLVLVSCGEEAGSGNDTGNSTQGTPSASSSQGTNSGEDTQQSSGTDVSAETDESSKTDVSTETDESSKTDVSSETDESSKTDVSTETDESEKTDTSSGTQSTESKKEDLPPEDEEPDEEPVIPDIKIDLAINGLSSYTVVYDDDNIRVKEFADKFVSYMSQTHKITLNMVGDSVGTDSDFCIYVGDVKGAKRAKAKLNSENDFGACVSGNDYVLYATNDRLYEYLYDALVNEVLFTIRGGNWSADPKYDYIYHSSSLKNTSYVDYVLRQNGGELTQKLLLKFFEARTFVASDGTTLVYRLYVPYHYDNTKEYPFLTLLHGAGERGSDNTRNMNNMVLNMFSLENSPMWDSIIVIPQCPDGQKWVDVEWADGGYNVEEVPESNELKAVMEIIDMVENSFPTDKDRYYVTGLSMGGFGTWDLIMRHTERFAGAVPLCGGGDYRYAEKLLNLPIYTIHDVKDPVVPFSGTHDMIVAFELLNSTAFRYEEVTGYYHNVWDYASQKAEIWTWLYEQSLEK